MARRGNLLDDVQIRRWVAKGAAIARSDGDGFVGADRKLSHF
ncbi:hypothetical protein [Aquabacterium sp.]|nr:hypothetical protein [Aquabacterium sp.]